MHDEMRSFLIAVIFLGSSVVCGQQQNADNRTTIYVGALVPDMHFDRFNFRAAMEVAEEVFNGNNEYLKDYKLKLQIHESHENVQVLLEFLSLVKRSPVNQLMIAGAFSKVAQDLLPITTLYNLSQLAYTARERFNVLKELDGEPVQYDKLEDKPFPYYVRLSPTIIRSNTARVKVFQHFKWKRVAIILDDRSELMFHTANDLKRQLEEADIKITTTQIVHSTNIKETRHQNLETQMNALINTNSKIIVVLTASEPARNIFCEAYRYRIYGDGIVWMPSGLVSDYFYSNSYYYNCTKNNYLKVIDGMINFKLVNIRPDSKLIFGNKTADDYVGMIKQRYMKNLQTFKKDNPNHSRQIRGFYRGSAYAFDSVLTAGIAIDKLIKEQGEQALLTDYGNSTKALEITKKIFQSNFEGLTGHVYFGKQPRTDERTGNTFVRQWYSRNNFTEGEYQVVAIHDEKENSLIVSENRNDTIFNDGVVRNDGSITVNRILRWIPLEQIIGLWILTSAGVILALVFLGINLKYRKIRLIKMSSPKINNGIVFGSLVCYASIILYGLDTRLISKRGMEITCNILPITLSIGFTFTFGCLFSKTWRVYKIFSAARTMEKVNTAALKDVRLYIIVFVLVGIDVFITAAWIGISPFRLVEVVFKVEPINQENVNEYYYHMCTCSYDLHFTLIMYIYKGLLLVVGLFLAWETRSIKVAALNDSQYIGMAVYNVFVVTVVGVICFYSLTDSTNYLKHGYLIVAFSIFMCTVITTIVVFAPKIHLLFGRSINSSVERALSVQTFSFAASVIRRSLREKKVSPAVESQRENSTVSIGSNH